MRSPHPFPDPDPRLHMNPNLDQGSDPGSWVQGPRSVLPAKAQGSCFVLPAKCAWNPQGGIQEPHVSRKMGAQEGLQARLEFTCHDG